MLQLQPHPTFKAAVEIQLHGGGTASITMVFKHRTTKEMEKFTTSEETQKLDDVGMVLAVAEGWEGVDAPFNEESVRKLCQNYRGAPFAIRDKYLAEHMQARLGN